MKRRLLNQNCGGRNYKKQKGANNEKADSKSGVRVQSECSPTIQLSAPTSDQKALKHRNDTLPEEMLLEIFSYLDLKDRLSARLVCRTWNSALSNWCYFTRNLSFNVLRTPNYNSFAILRSSNVPWKNISLALKNGIAPNYSTWYFPKLLYYTLTTLEIMEGTITWSWIFEVAGRFQSLDKLIFNMCRIERDGGTTGICAQDSAKPVCLPNMRKRGICLKLIMTDFSTLNSYLRQFAKRYDRESSFSLMQLKIAVPELERSKGITPAGKNLLRRFSQNLAKLSVSARSTLKSVILKAGGAVDATYKFIHIMEENVLNQSSEVVKVEKVAMFANNLDAIVHKFGEAYAGKYFFPAEIKMRKSSFVIPLLLPPKTQQN